LSAKEDSIEKLLSPVRETLGKLESQTKQLETERGKAYTEVLTEMKNIQRTHETLRMETTQLVQALRAPKARGNWGELQLKRCIEFAGMVERCSFDVEKHMKGNDIDPAQRPDVVVQLPNGRAIIIDAKTPLDAYLSDERDRRNPADDFSEGSRRAGADTSHPARRKAILATSAKFAGLRRLLSAQRSFI